MKKYIPAGDSNIWQSYGLDPNTVKTISDKELANIPTDDGVPKIDYYNSETHKQGIWKMVVNLVLPFIPVIGQLYTMYQGISAIKKGDYWQGALNFFGAGGKIPGLPGGLNMQLGTIARFVKYINPISIALFANDLTDGSGRKIQGVNRFLAGLQFGGNYLLPNLPRLPGINLNDAQLQYLAKVGANIDKISDYYQKGVMITGKEKIFGGKEVSDEERIQLAGSLLGSHIQQAASNPNTNIADAIKQGVGSFVTDMVVNTPVNAVNDATQVLNYTMNQALKAYTSIVKTENGLIANAAGQIIEGINLPTTLLNNAMTVYGRVGGFVGSGMNAGAIGNAVFKWISEQLDKIFNNQNNTNTQQMVDEAIKTAEDYVGTKYVSGGESKEGIDCSGLVRKLYPETFKKDMTADEMYDSIVNKKTIEGSKVERSEVKAGDLVFWKGHVEIITKVYGNGRVDMIGASYSKGEVVKRFNVSFTSLENNWGPKFYGYIRLLP
ncbi:MAG: NlpC/P60 family protein [bacterium]